MKKMNSWKLLFLFCLSVIYSSVIAAAPPTCPAADVSNECGGSDSSEWEGEFFPQIPKIKYEDWIRFSVAFWHTFRGTGGAPFGAATKVCPWEDGTNSLAMAKRRMRANFEFINKLGVDLWCFHDRDIAPDGKTVEESNANLDEVVQLVKEIQSYGLGIATATLCFTAVVPRAVPGLHTSCAVLSLHPSCSEDTCHPYFYKYAYKSLYFLLAIFGF